MKICNRGINFVQVLANGDVRLCCWSRNNVIGNLLEQDFYEIYHGKKAQRFQESLLNGTYEFCKKDRCPYLANGNIEGELVELEQVPEYPKELHLAYERTCNYKCTSCYNFKEIPEEYKHNTEIIEQKLQKPLSKAKTIGANGNGELFASKSILRILHDWKPEAPENEISVTLETNGSLFTPQNWEKISNLGRYHLKVCITIMSFDEGTYQFLSGTKLPISNLEQNLLFVKGLREKGVINEVELATVMQEYNFREMPLFVQRCIEEFGADVVRVRPYYPWGVRDAAIEWFFDMRNPMHPYYPEFQRIMKEPIMKHPKVWEWANQLSSDLGKHPYYKEKAIADVFEEMLRVPDCFTKMKHYILNKGFTDIAIYGVGRIGKLCIDNHLPIGLAIDEFSMEESYNGVKIIRMGANCENKISYILITLSEKMVGLKEQLQTIFDVDCEYIEYIGDVVKKLDS